MNHTSENSVHNLFKFLKEGVTNDKMQEANLKAYPITEGKLPADLSTIENPEKTIQSLAEEAKGDIAPAEITPEPPLTAVEKDADKKTPDIDKLTQDKEGQDPGTEAPTKKDEGKLPSDPSTIVDPEKDIQALSEEKVLTTVSDENVAKELQRKYPGSRIVNDVQNGKKNFIIMVKEDVDVAVTSDGKTVSVTSTPDSTVVTTTNAPVDVTPDLLNQPPLVPEVPAVEEPKVEEVPAVEAPAEEVEFSDDEAFEMAERLFVASFLETKKSLTEKEQKFVTETKSKKLSEKNQVKVNAKLETLKKA